jgi:hypothetical protein
MSHRRLRSLTVGLAIILALSTPAAAMTVEDGITCGLVCGLISANPVWCFITCASNVADQANGTGTPGPGPNQPDPVWSMFTPCTNQVTGAGERALAKCDRCCSGTLQSNPTAMGLCEVSCVADHG